MHKTLLSVIVLSYNGKNLTIQCLISLLNSTYNQFEIIVIDNCSTDGSLEALEQAFYNEPRIKIIPMKKNYGFAIGNNMGYEYASHHSEYMLFLNNDTIVERDCLEKVIGKMEVDHSIGAAQPKIMSMMDMSRINAVGGILDYYGRTWNIGEGEIDKKQYDKITDIFYAQGAALFVRREMVEKIGLFDPMYFMYYEDTDLSWRSWLAGYRVKLIPDGVIYHYVGAGSKSMDSTTVEYFKLFHHRKNHITTMLKNYSLVNILKYVLPFIVSMLFIANYWTTEGKKNRSLAYYKSLWWIIRHTTYIVKERAFIQKIRRISDKDIMEKMRPA